MATNAGGTRDGSCGDAPAEIGFVATRKFQGSIGFRTASPRAALPAALPAVGRPRKHSLCRPARRSTPYWRGSRTYRVLAVDRAAAISPARLAASPRDFQGKTDLLSQPSHSLAAL